MKKIIITTLLCILSTFMWAQSTTLSLPELATPSPKASMINRFGTYPTNLYTGLVDITVPIHTISLKGISIPIEFKYHASGLKYDDLPLELGYGWTLIAGGTVSYSARALGIERPQGREERPYIKLVSEIRKNDKTGSVIDSDQRQLEYVMNASKRPIDIVDYYRDSEFDVYNFSFPGYTGQYYRLSDREEFSIPAGTTCLMGDSYSIAYDGNGNQFRFEENDRDEYGRNYTQYLTQIITADKADTIRFTYRQFAFYSDDAIMRPIVDDTYIIMEKTLMGGLITVEKEGGSNKGIYTKRFNTPVLTEISYKGGKVSFVYSATSKRSLEQIDIKDYAGRTYKSVTLDKRNHKYLDAVNFKGINGQHLYSYNFEYNGLKPEGGLKIDYWGYYKEGGASSVYRSSYYPNFTVQVYGRQNGYQLPGMDRSPNESCMKLGTLRKIVYPTKGYSVFDFEAHRADSQIYGGLRIREIKNYDENDNLLESKYYKYGVNETGNGRPVRRIEHRDFLTNSLVAPLDNSHIQGYFAVKSIHYKTYGSFPVCSYFSSGSSVVYPCITEYTGSPTGANGKTVYYYTDFEDYWYNRTMRGHVTEIPLYSYAWKSGKLLGKNVWDGNGQLQYQLSNSYEEINRQDHLNLRVLPYAQIGPGAVSIEKDFSGVTNGNYANAIGGSLHDYYNYYITQGEYVVKESREMVNGVSKTTHYQYNEMGQVIEEKVIESDGSELATRFKYPYEFKETAAHNSMHAIMNERNILAPVLEKEQYKNNTLLAKTVNEYRKWYTYLVAPEYVKQLVGSNLEERIRYHSYDGYGNPREISKDNLEKVVYLWGCKGKFPVAEIRNGTYSQLVSVLGQTFLDNLTNASYPSTAQMNQLEGLRTNPALSNCQITTFYYDAHQTGVSQIVAPNGMKTYYEYDAFGRLMQVKDHYGKITDAYQYNYKQ